MSKDIAAKVSDRSKLLHLALRRWFATKDTSLQPALQRWFASKDALFQFQLHGLILKIHCFNFTTKMVWFHGCFGLTCARKMVCFQGCFASTCARKMACLRGCFASNCAQKMICFKGCFVSTCTPRMLCFNFRSEDCLIINLCRACVQPAHITNSFYEKISNFENHLSSFTLQLKF